MSSENRNDIENEERKKASSARFFEKGWEKMAKDSQELNLSQAEIFDLYQKAFDRIHLEQTSSQGENLKSLHLYTDKITNLFTAMAESTDEKVLKEQEKALAAEKKFTDQVAITNQIKNEAIAKLKEYKETIEDLEEDVQRYKDLESATEARIKDKDDIINSRDDSIRMKDNTIVQLTEELNEAKKASKSLKTLEGKIESIETEKKNLEGKLKQKDFEIKQAVLNTKVELQEQYQKNTQDLMLHYQKQEQIRIDNETELRKEYKAEIERASTKHTEELNNLKAQYKDGLEQLQVQHKEEVASLEKKLTDVSKPSSRSKANTTKKKVYKTEE
ncbi:hypothetical protein [Priestia aryabhattai]|uniref:hypothetical protein n=1 Tax=Priestia aryabhattai TaxID=412384 RepID=UPI0008DC78C4|nr:hypothetical protein [Priestia aryabhattai]OHY73280.1 hypothetical protein BCV52_27145 [Priestia aryabhattai]